jgi:hypothetical protein
MSKERLIEDAKAYVAKNFGAANCGNEVLAEYLIDFHEAQINIPHTADFMEAVRLEAAHQIGRWGTDHDKGKEPTDWLWLIGYLAGKATNAAIAGDIEKAKHHTISTAAVMLNWHRHLNGDETTFRPGTDLDG